MTEQKNLTVNRPSDSDLDAPIDAKAWINVDFTKDGRHIPIQELYDSQAIAKEAADKFVAEASVFNDKSVRACGCAAEIVDQNRQHLYWWPEYSHTLQLPADKP